MRASNLVESVEFCFNNNLVPYVEGQPGVGKSSIFKEVAEKMGVDLIDFRPALHGIEDFLGLPTFSADKKRSSFATPTWLPTSGKGIFFIDELPQSSPAMMAALSQFILDRRIGDYTLPEGWHIAAAGNRQADRAATHKRPSHINDRLVIMEMDFNLDDFIGFCRKNEVPNVIQAFCKFKPNVLTSFDPNHDVNCTPRSMIMASKMIDADPKYKTEMLQGTIGEGPTAEFMGFQRVWQDLPPLEDILAKPKTIKIADKLDVRYAISTMLSAHATKDNFDTMMKFMERLPVEFQVAFARDAYYNNKEVNKCKSFAEMIRNHANLIAD